MKFDCVTHYAVTTRQNWSHRKRLLLVVQAYLTQYVINSWRKFLPDPWRQPGLRDGQQSRWDIVCAYTLSLRHVNVVLYFFVCFIYNTFNDFLNCIPETQNYALA